ncbi:MAG: hypothetical protein JXR97_03820 [Planctomycetes bacterium]|nr:hypothetical protein [Planctomycetota bacterium]
MKEEQIQDKGKKQSPGTTASGPKDERAELAALLKLVGTLGLTVCVGITCFFFSA